MRTSPIFTHQSIKRDVLIGEFEVPIPLVSPMNCHSHRVFHAVINKHVREHSANVVDKVFGETRHLLFGSRTLKEPSFWSQSAVLCSELFESRSNLRRIQHIPTYIDGINHASGHGVVRVILLIWLSIFISVVNGEVRSVQRRLENSTLQRRFAISTLQRHVGLEIIHGLGNDSRSLIEIILILKDNREQRGSEFEEEQREERGRFIPERVPTQCLVELAATESKTLDCARFERSGVK